MMYHMLCKIYNARSVGIDFGCYALKLNELSAGAVAMVSEEAENFQSMLTLAKSLVYVLPSYLTNQM